MDEQKSSASLPEKNNSNERYFKVVKSLRTYEGDIAEAVREKKASQASIHLEEQQRIREEKKADPEETSIPKKRWPISIAVLIIILMAGGLMIIWLFPTVKAPPTVTENPPENLLIKADIVRTLEITGKSRTEIDSLTKQAIQDILPTENQRLVQVNFTQKNILGKNVEITPETFFGIFSPTAPPSLVRSLGNRVNYGFLIENSDQLPFVISEIESFENTFEGMILWEKTISEDLAGFLTVTAEETAEKDFEDFITRNKDLRVLKDSTGSSIILYSFLDKNVLLIARNEVVFREVLDRYLVKKLSG